MATISEALAIAIQLHQAGRLQAAEQIYRQILAVEPNQVDAIHLLGLIAHQVGKHGLAVEYIGRAIRLKGNAAAFHNNLGNALKDQGKLDDAVACYRRALELEPDYAEAHNNLGSAFKEQGKLDDAVACYRRALELKPGYAEVHNNLGTAFRMQGNLDEAAACYRQALQRNPDYAEAHSNLGVVFKEQGNLEDAAACFRRALELKPGYAEAHNNLGVAFKDQEKLDDAVACYHRALELKPDYAEAHYNLGNALKEQRKFDNALACYQRVLELKPDYAEAHGNLGVVFKEQGNLDDALARFRGALQRKPDFAEAHGNLGVIYRDQGKFDDAIACYRRALELKPDYAEAHYNLGNAFKDQGKLDDAIACYRRALELKPADAAAHNNLGIALKDQGKLNDAVACFRRALELKPEFAAAHNNLGVVFKDQGKPDEALACCRRALELKPDFAEAHNNLGVAFKDQGNLDDALACFRRALELKPDYAAADSNLLYTQVFCPGCDPLTLYEEHRRWNRQHAEPLGKFIEPHPNDCSPQRRLRIGYLSPDFRRHPVGRFLLPLLESHDRGSFEIFCYASVRIPDTMTDRCRAHADVWRDVLGLPDEQVAHAIRQDQIDILVDLTMHMANNRLLVFARKPAPIQVTYLAYCGTTGLSTIDYRLSDPYLDPPGGDERIYCEQTVRLPQTYWCYRPPLEAPPVNALPALEAGHVSFGSLNNFCKVTSPVLAAWGRLLQAVRGSRLLLHAFSGSHRDRVRVFLDEQGISAERVVFVDFLPTAEYLGVYQRIDVALDPFPYGGGTTTCDALWMGVPVVSLAGPTAVGRGGVSILSNLGLPELVAQDPEQYVRIAAKLAYDLSRLSALRASLRDRMQASPLMDAPRFARNVEAAYRTMWQRWCAK
ncbi:MAG: tetratricopeptide repeat protein [Thermoguttaceae bacterium]